MWATRWTTTDEGRAQEVAATLTRLIREGRYTSWQNGTLTSRVPDHFIVQSYDRNILRGWKWGVVERWRYADRPELGVFGGEFLPLDHARRFL